jgi:hypothetical protein
VQLEMLETVAEIFKESHSVVDQALILELLNALAFSTSSDDGHSTMYYDAMVQQVKMCE